MTSANLTVALPTADATMGKKTDCRLSDDQIEKFMEMSEMTTAAPSVGTNSSAAKFVVS